MFWWWQQHNLASFVSMNNGSFVLVFPLDSIKIPLPRICISFIRWCQLYTCTLPYRFAVRGCCILRDFPNIPCVCIYMGLLWKLENYEFEGPFLRFQTISSRTQCVLIGHSVSSLECLWQKNQYLDLCCSLFV